MMFSDNTIKPDGQPIDPAKYLFCFYMAGGNATIFENLKSMITRCATADTTWLPIETHPNDAITRVPPFRWIGSLANSAVTGKRIHALHSRGLRFDAAYYFQHTTAMFLWRFRRRVPHVIAMDGTPLWYGKNGLWYAHPFFVEGSLEERVKTAITRSVYRGAFRLLPLSSGVRHSLINDYGIEPEKIEVVPPGIDVGAWNYVDRSQKNHHDRVKVLFVGAGLDRKGGDLLLALAHREEFRNVEFHFVTLAKAEIERDNVVMHHGYHANDPRLIELYRSADIFALPTRADSHSLVSLEAMAVGMPVISTKVGGIPDIIEDGVNGFLLNPDDIEGLGARLKFLVSERSLRLQMGERARRRVESDFNLEIIAARVLALMRMASQSKRNFTGHSGG